jgi:hypothetical protein
MDKNIPNFSHMTGQDAKVYGPHNKLNVINPYNCYFMVKYPDGTVVRGNNLFETGWDNIPNGFTQLSYVLSTGKIIPIPKFKAYLPLIECSLGIDGSKVFHSIQVKCLEPHCIQTWKIILKEDSVDTRFKIGDVFVGREPLPKSMSKSWKYTS